MSETKSSKVVWIIVGAIIGSVIALAFDKWIKPIVISAPKASLQVVASSDTRGVSNFSIQNTGKAPAEEVVFTIWSSAPFASRTDIVKLKHIGGVSDAICEKTGIWDAKLTASGSVPNAINTESKAAIIVCKRINPDEKWQGIVEWSGSEAVFGLMIHIKANGISENQYAMFNKESAK